MQIGAKRAKTCIQLSFHFAYHSWWLGKDGFFFHPSFGGMLSVAVVTSG